MEAIPSELTHARRNEENVEMQLKTICVRGLYLYTIALIVVREYMQEINLNQLYTIALIEVREYRQERFERIFTMVLIA